MSRATKANSVATEAIGSHSKPSIPARTSIVGIAEKLQSNPHIGHGDFNVVDADLRALEKRLKRVE
jgi:hypothetical protein